MMADIPREENITILIEACLLAGKIMLQSGAETYRVEDTMTRMAQSCGVRAESFVMPTGIIFSTDDAKWTKLNRIESRSTDLHKITRVNQISRQLGNGLMTVDMAFTQLRAIQDTGTYYHILFRIFFAAITSGCFLLMYGGAWSGLGPACVAGGAGYAIVFLIQRWIHLQFFAELTASFAIGAITSLFSMIGLGHSFDTIVIASVMPLVPGILITNAVRDLMAGHLVSGISKGAEATLTAFAIGAGIAVAIQIL